VRLKGKGLQEQVSQPENAAGRNNCNRRGAQRSCNGGEDAAYPQQDGKTLCTFTVRCHCVLDFDA